MNRMLLVKRMSCLSSAAASRRQAIISATITSRSTTTTTTSGTSSSSTTITKTGGSSIPSAASLRGRNDNGDGNKSPSASGRKGCGPRRVVVVRRGEGSGGRQPKGEDGEKISSSKKRRKRIGRFVPPKFVEIKDTSGQSILIPPPSKKRSSNKNPSSFPLQQLPSINASSLLSAEHYCKASANAATSKSGMDAARRLLRGKKELLTVIRHHVWKNSGSKKKDQSQKNIFVLTGHGVPTQLLQDHIDFCDAVLRKCGHNIGRGMFSSTTCTATRNTGGEAGFCQEQLSSTSGYLSNNYMVHWMTSSSPRSTVDGKLRSHPWPFRGGAEDSDAINSSLQLYLTVMHRISHALGGTVLVPILPPHSEKESRETEEENDDANDESLTVDEYDNEWTSSSETETKMNYPRAVGRSEMKHWKVELLRGGGGGNNFLPPQHLTIGKDCISNQGENKRTSPPPTVTIQWLPREGRLCLRLHGYPSSLLYNDTMPPSSITTSDNDNAKDSSPSNSNATSKASDTKSSTTSLRRRKRQRLQPVSLRFDAFYLAT